MPLSEDEQRILHQIEQQFYESDPNFAGELGTHTLYVHHLRRLKWAGLTFVLGVIVMVGSLWRESTVLLAFAGVVIMLVSALWFEHHLRKLGRAGLAQISESMRANGLRDYLGSSGQRFRDRFRHSDD